MKILKLSASFGNLQNAELTLEDGLNIVTAPNESGKSTWAAFLTAMLYGMDSSARATKTSLPAKAKYKPWSGAPMQGKMELEWQGRHITIERSTKGRVPMGEFRAYETESGLPVAGMTGENCGEMLLGVGQSVLERSAFIGQGAVAVTSDAELEKRLSSLVTAGDETVSFSDTQKTLRDWRNRCRHNRTGLLPQTLMELQQVENTLDQIHRLHQGDMALRAKREQCTKQQQHLQTVLAGLRAREAARAFEKKDAAARELADASARCADAKKSVERLPSAQTLTELPSRSLRRRRRRPARRSFSVFPRKRFPRRRGRTRRRRRHSAAAARKVFFPHSARWRQPSCFASGRCFCPAERRPSSCAPCCWRRRSAEAHGLCFCKKRTTPAARAPRRRRRS